MRSLRWRKRREFLGVTVAVAAALVVAMAGVGDAAVGSTPMAAAVTATDVVPASTTAPTWTTAPAGPRRERGPALFRALAYATRDGTTQGWTGGEVVPGLEPGDSAVLRVTSQASWQFDLRRR